MSKHRNLDYGDRLPEAVEDAFMEFIGTGVFNLKLDLANSTTLRIAGGSDNAQAAVGINGRWRYNTSAITAAHPSASAGTYPFFVTAADNVFTPTGAPPGDPPETDDTVYTFGLQIRVDGANPSTALYRQLGTVDWNGAAITAIHSSYGFTPLLGSIDETMLNPANVDGVVGKASLRTLGTGGQQAAAGNDTRIPTQPENDALVGTSGSPSSTNKYVTDADSRVPTTTEAAALAGTSGTPGNSNRYVTDADSRLVAVSSRFTGEIVMYAGPTAPAGWVLCDGTQYDGNNPTYAALWAGIGNTYGGADKAHMAVPDLRGRFPLGKAASGTGNALGMVGGLIDHVHTGPAHTHTMPSHTHSTPNHTHTGTTGGPSGLVGAEQVGSSNRPQDAHTHSFTTNSGGGGTSGGGGNGNTGSDGTANTGTANPPYQVVNYIIKL